MDLFADRAAAPMLVGASGEAFDSPDCLYELKLDGERALAYLDASGAELRNKRNRRMLPVFPELGGIHRQVRERCILDGEYVVLRGGKPSFAEVQRRSLLSNPLRIRLAAQKLPVSFVAFDILYLGGRDLTRLPLAERRGLLERAVSESPRLAVSRAVEGRGRELFAAAARAGLEGVVAKYKGSLYYPGRRTREWVKFKNMLDDDFVICGYLLKENRMASLVLAQYGRGALVYRGHVTLGVSGGGFRRVRQRPPLESPPLPVPPGNEGAVWIAPELVCTVEFLERTPEGGLRHPVFKGLRDDKLPRDCIARET